MQSIIWRGQEMTNEIIYKKLDNGLQICLCPDNSKHSVIMDLIVKYGGFYSDFIINGNDYHMNDGMAHLIEHLMCEKNSQGVFWEMFGKKQMSTNACTTPFITEFYVDTVEDVYYALENLLIALSNPVFTAEDIEATKPPIYQEIKMRNDEVGRRIAYTRVKNSFKVIPYINGLGTEENVKNFTYEDVKLCYDSFYQPENEILFIAGNFDAEKIYEKIKKVYEKFTFKKIDFAYKKYDEVDEVALNYEEIMMPVSKDYIDVCYKVNLKNIPKYKLRMYTYYISLFLNLNFSNISPLYKKLLKDEVIDASISTGFSFYDDYLLISAGAYVNNEDSFISEVKKVFENTHYDNKKFFNLRLKKEKMNKICQNDNPGSLLDSFIGNIAIFDYLNFDSVEEINALNYEEYNEFINSLEFKNYTITKVTNIK
jgi:zinc protease